MRFGLAMRIFLWFVSVVQSQQPTDWKPQTAPRLFMCNPDGNWLPK